VAQEASVSDRESESGPRAPGGAEDVSAALFQALTQHSRDIISLLDAQGRLVFNSAAAERISGFSLEELAGIDTFELIHPDDRERVRQVFADLLAKPGRVATVVYRYRNKAGGWTWMEALASNHVDDPAVRGVVTHSRDITERKLAEEALRAANERFRQFLASCEEGFGRLDNDGVFVECNDQLAEMFACDGQSELLGHHYGEFVYPEDLPRTREHEGHRRRGLSAGYTTRLRRRDGTECWLRISSVPLRDDAGAVTGAFLFFTDVTEARAIETRALRAQRAQELAAAEAEPESVASWRGVGWALVADAESIVRSAARRALERLGFEVEEAVDGLEAVEAVTRQPARYALVLLDQSLPRLGGIGALRRIRALAPALPVLLSTGYPRDELAEELRDLRGWTIVEKPYDRAAFNAAVRVACLAGG
jgi:PAS domain S-box-containing protein